MAVRTDQDEELHPITVEAYHRMFELGVLTEDDRVELLDGALIAMSPQGDRHHRVATELAGRFWRGTPEHLMVTTHGPMTASPLSEPEPDVFVVDATAFDGGGHPSSGHLLVEVSSTSLRKDLLRKARIYASAGVPEYWVIDVQRDAVHVHRDPAGDGYVSVEEVGPPAVLRPLHSDLPTVDLGALLRR